MERAAVEGLGTGRAVRLTFAAARCGLALACVGGLLAAAPAAHARSLGASPPVGGAKRAFAAADILELKKTADVQISPDGRRVAFVVSANDVAVDRARSSIWIVDAQGGVTRRLVRGEASQPRWSPDSALVAYLAADPQGRTQIMVVNPAGGRPIILTHLEQAPDALTWSPDGRAIAFTAFTPEPAETLGAPLPRPAGARWAPPIRFTTGRHVVADGAGFVPPGHTHLFTVAVSDGAVRTLTAGPRNDGAPTWSPDGRAIVFTSAPDTPAGSDLFTTRIHRIALATGGDTQVSPDAIEASLPAVSPDGAHIAFVGYSERPPGAFGSLRIYLMDQDGSHVRVLAPALDRLQSQPTWTADGRAVLAAYADHSLDEVGRLGLDGSVQVLARHSAESYSLARDGAVGFALGAPDRPAEAGVAEAGSQRRLSALNADLLDAIAVGATRPLAVRSALDGAQVGAWMVLPPHYDPARRYPLILDIHGGPFFYDGPDWDTDAQVFAGAGYVVLHANYRGSTSYGSAFTSRVDFDFPGDAAYTDLMSAVDAAISAGIADPARLFVTGGSAGGIMTAWIIGKTHRFRAAAASKPSVNFLGAALETDQYAYDATSDFGATPWKSPWVFWRHSPLSLVGGVTTPTLLIVGEDDRRTPPGQSLEFYNALKIRGVPTGLILVPGASHEGLESRPSQHAAQLLAIIAWFRRYDPVAHAASP